MAQIIAGNQGFDLLGVSWQTFDQFLVTGNTSFFAGHTTIGHTLAYSGSWSLSASGLPTSGTISGYIELDGSGSLVWGANGFNLPLSTYQAYSSINQTEGMFRSAMTGADELLGGTGADRLDGFDGNDSIFGGDGADTLMGVDGNDFLQGSAGNDNLTGSAGADTIYGGKGDDFISTGTTTDTSGDVANGNLGNDSVLGDAGSDLLFGGQGNDLVAGGAGNDTLYGDRGNDTLNGGLGVDRFMFALDSGQDSIVEFNPSEGDRIVLLGGQSVTSIANPSAVRTQSIIHLSGGGEITVGGYQPSQFSSDWILIG